MSVKHRVKGVTSKGGFTLVELLVVIGIIGILIAILLPALNKARQAALKISCASRMRQLGMMFQMYVVNNHGLYPALIKYYADGTWTWVTQVSWSYGNITDGLLLTGSQYVGYRANGADYSKSLYRCPAQPKTKVGTYGYYGYAYNTYIGENGMSPHDTGELRKSNHRHPSETMLLMEAGDAGLPSGNSTRPYQATVCYSHTFADAYYTGYAIAAMRHGGSGKETNPGGMNIAYLDGHVAWWNDISTLPTNRRDIFWSSEIRNIH